MFITEGMKNHEHWSSSMTALRRLSGERDKEYIYLMLSSGS
jgi:hypothetical protein